MSTEATATSVDHVPAGSKWEFDGEVTACFDDMLARSIPQYEVMRAACYDLGRKYVQPKTDIVDLGCSRGEAMAPFVREFGATVRHLGIEQSEPMVAAARERFAGMIDAGVVNVRPFDLREGYPVARASLTLAVLTLQFTPIEFRQRILRDAYNATVTGGAMIVVEKVLGATADLDSLLNQRYWAMKEANGYDQDHIHRKRLALQGVLVPVTARWNEDLIRSAGFAQVDCFWRWMNFAGWVAVKS